MNVEISVVVDFLCCHVVRVHIITLRYNVITLCYNIITWILTICYNAITWILTKRRQKDTVLSVIQFYKMDSNLTATQKFNNRHFYTYVQTQTQTQTSMLLAGFSFCSLYFICTISLSWLSWLLPFVPTVYHTQHKHAPGGIRTGKRPLGSSGFEPRPVPLFCGKESGAGTAISLATLAFLCQYHLSMLHTQSVVYNGRYKILNILGVVKRHA
jgi:hypothetical protein